MGITYRDALMYRAARRRGTSFRRTMTLGHLELYLHRPEIQSLRDQYQEEFGRAPSSLASYEWGQFADRFLEDFLGVEELTVLDASGYQGADAIHDLNQPVPETLRNRFDVIIDGGTLEHVFNVPVAFSNLGYMLVVGGTVFISTPANNLMGHGFYQFSPELMFRVFSEENGFSLENVSLLEARFPSIELTRNSRLYKVTDPETVRRRVGLMSRRPVLMLVEAVKNADREMFTSAPIQSDYAAAWSPADNTRAEKSLPRKAASEILRRLPRSLARQIHGQYQRRQYSLRNGDAFKRMGDAEPNSTTTPRN